MVLALLMLLFLAVISFGLWAYSRALLVSAATQAARFAANADVDDVDLAAARARDLMTATVAGGRAETIVCVAATDEPRMVGLRCTMSAPSLVAPLASLLPDITVTAHAYREARP